jgi:hypothetical protein
LGLRIYQLLCVTNCLGTIFFVLVVMKFGLSFCVIKFSICQFSKFYPKLNPIGTTVVLLVLCGGLEFACLYFCTQREEHISLSREV